MLRNIFVVSILFISSFGITSSNDIVKNVTVDELEKQKDELFKQINVAIDESVQSLLRANDTEAVLGLQYMRDLKEHLDELNRTENSDERREVDIDSKSDLENRRSNKRSMLFSKKKKRPSSDPFDFESVLKPKKITEKEWKEMLENRQKMQQKLDWWLLEREREKERIKKYKQDKLKLLMSGKYEKCPRFGYFGKKKKEKKKGRDRTRLCKMPLNFTDGKKYENCPILDLTESSSEEKKKRRRLPSEKNKYPCCRKCCKKSYMGCL